MVAKHVIEQEKGGKRENIRKAIAFLKETDGLLKIEDILPFFPDFALIDDFKVEFSGLLAIMLIQLFPHVIQAACSIFVVVGPFTYSFLKIFFCSLFLFQVIQ